MLNKFRTPNVLDSDRQASYGIAPTYNIGGFVRANEGNPVDDGLWTKIFHLTVDDGGWVSSGVNDTPYVEGSGWATALIDEEDPDSGKGAFIELTLTEFTVLSVRVYFRWVTPPITSTGFVFIGDNEIDFEADQYFRATVSGGSLATLIKVALQNGGGNAVGYITRIVLQGTGVNPFV